MFGSHLSFPTGGGGGWVIGTGVSQSGIAYFLPLRNIWTIKLFVNWGQISLINGKNY